MDPLLIPTAFFVNRLCRLGASKPEWNRATVDEREFEKLRLMPNRRLRQAFLDDAEERSARVLGRPLTHDELTRVLRHYPGDITRTNRERHS
jgi:hypothetical protein